LHLLFDVTFHDREVARISETALPAEVEDPIGSIANEAEIRLNHRSGDRLRITSKAADPRL